MPKPVRISFVQLPIRIGHFDVPVFALALHPAVVVRLCGDGALDTGVTDARAEAELDSVLLALRIN